LKHAGYARAVDINRRSFFGAAGATGLLVIGVRNSGVANGAPTNGPVTIQHRFGQTTIPAPPRRVVSAGFTEQDDLLAVGVVPIAVTKWWGDEPFEVWPWAQSKLGSAQPEVLSIYDDGFQFDRIAALQPDLIVAINAGVDQDSYNRLSAIAPTIPQSGDAPFFEPWKTQATTIGQATLQSDKMQSLITQADNRFSSVAKANPQFRGKNALLLQGTLFQDQVAATLPGWRTDFLTQMGFRIPDSVNAFTIDEHRAFIPRDQIVPVLNTADVLIWTTESDADEAGLRADPAFQQLNATAQNRNVFTGKEVAGAIAFSSPLSLPVVANQLPPMFNAALNR
jgi:iron complex transport system substrate-binding protein